MHQAATLASAAFGPASVPRPFHALYIRSDLELQKIRGCRRIKQHNLVAEYLARSGDFLAGIPAVVARHVGPQRQLGRRGTQAHLPGVFRNFNRASR